MLNHVYSQTVPDSTATSVVRPSDWNSGHVEGRTLSGNTAGASTISGLDLVFVGGNNITISADTAGGKIVFSGANTSGGVALSAGTNSTAAGTVVFSNSNGVTFGMDGAGIVTGSVQTNYLTTAMQSNAATISNMRVSAGTTSNLLSALTFSNGSGVTFGLNASTLTASVETNYQTPGAYLTTAMQSNAATISNINVSAGTTSNLLSALTFSNGSGVSWGLNGSVVTATVATNYQSAGAYLTTAMQSNAATISNIRVSAGTTSNLLSAVTFSNSNGLAFGLNAGTITGSYTVPSTAGLLSNINVSAGTTSNNLSALTFSNSNGVSFGLNGSVVTGSHNGLTTARASTDAVGLNTAQSNVTWTVNSGGLSFDARGYAGTGTSGTNVSITLNSNGIAISAGGGAGDGYNSAQFTNSTANSTMPIVWAGNSNGSGNITMGLTGSTVTASYNGLTTARASNDAVGLNTALTAGPLAWTVNSSGISLNAGSAAGTTSGFGGNLISGSMTHNTAGLNLSLNHPAWLTTAMQSNAATLSNIRISAGTTSNLASAFTFDNGNGVSFGLNAGTITASHNGLTTARASNDGVGLNTAQSNVTWTVNSSGLSFDARGYVGTATAFSGTNVSATMTHNSAGFSLQLSGGGGGVINQTGPNISAGTDSLFTSGTVTFGNAFSGSFVTSNGSVVYSNAFLTTAAQSGHSHGNPTLALTNLSGTTASASNGLTLSLSAAAPGGGATESLFWRPNDSFTTVGAPINASASIIYCPIDHALSASRFDLFASIAVTTAGNNSSAGFLYSITAVLYTLNGNTLSSVSSAVTNNQMTWSSNVTGAVTGGFFLSAPLNVNAAADKYWVGVQLSTRATGLTGAATTSLGNTVSMMGVGTAVLGAVSAREPGSATSNSAGWVYGMGMYSGTSNFSTIGLSNLTQQGSNMARANVALRMLNQ